MIFYCDYCKKKHDDWNWVSNSDGHFCRKAYSPSRPKEYVPERIKEDRKKYFNSLLQPMRGDTISKEYCEAYPEAAKRQFGDKVKTAKNVWSDLPGYSTRDKSQ